VLRSATFRLKTLLFASILVLLCTLPLSTLADTESHNASLSTPSGSEPNYYRAGYSFKYNGSSSYIILKNFTKMTSDQASYVEVYNMSSCANLSLPPSSSFFLTNISFVGNVSSMGANNITILQDTCIAIIEGHVGGSWTEYYTSPYSYPYSNDSLSWLARWKYDGTWSWGTGEIDTVKFIGFDAYNFTAPTTITLLNIMNSSPIIGANITLSTGSWNTTDAMGTANFNSTTANYTYTYLAEGYFNRSGIAVPNITNYDYTGQAIARNITFTTKIIGALLATPYNSSVNGTKYVFNGSDQYIWMNPGTTTTLSFNKTGYYGRFYNYTANLFDNITLAEANASNLVINFTTYNNTSSVNTFTINLSNTTLSYFEPGTTTNGWFAFYLTQGIHYNYTIDAPGYSYVNGSSNPITNYSLINTSLQNERTILISIHDEENNSLANQNWTIELWTNTNGYNYTTTGSGTYTTGVLSPNEYEIRYYTRIGDYAIPRSYFITITAKSSATINVYALKDNSSQYFTLNIRDQYNQPVENATISMMRGYIVNSSVVSNVVAMSKSDSSGQSLFRVIPNTVYYKFYVNSARGSITSNYAKLASSSLGIALQATNNIFGNYVIEKGVQKNLSYNACVPSCDTFSWNWNDPTGTVVQGCLRIQKWNAQGTYTSSQSCANGSLGSIVYPIPDYNQTSYTAIGILTLNDGSVDPVGISHNYRTDFQYWGLMGVFITILVFIFAVFIAPSADGVLIAGALSLVLMGVIGILAYSWSAIVGILIIVIVAAYKMRSAT
jgi:hypothetical protein